MYRFEIFLLKNHVTAEEWQKLHVAISQYLGLLGSYTLHITFEDNVARFFVEAKKNVGVISSNFESILLRPLHKNESLEVPQARARKRFLRFVTGGSLFDFREKYHVKNMLDLTHIRIKVHPVVDQKDGVKMDFFFKAVDGSFVRAVKTAVKFPNHLLAIDFESNAKLLKKPIPKYLDIEKSLAILSSEPINELFTVDTFPYFSEEYFINLRGFEFDRHSFIVGASGSGKSKFIELFIDKIYKAGLQDQYRIIVIDPHAAIAPELQHIPNQFTVNFTENASDLFPVTNDATAATELSTQLFKSLLKEQFNPKLERVLRFSLYVLFTGNMMTFDNLKRYLMELEVRNAVMSQLDSAIPTNVKQFFATDYNEIRTKHYNEAILPIISLIDEMQMLPGLADEANVSLLNTIRGHFLTNFSLNKVSMGEKVVKTVAGLLIQHIFVLAQARVIPQKIILIVDEVSVVQNPTLAQILAEARKFGLSVIMSQQYLSQVDKDLRDAIFSNMYNYYAFKVSEEDARLLEGNMTMEIPDELLHEAKAKGMKETDMRVKVLTELHAREALVRLYGQGKFHPCVRVKTVDVELKERHLQKKPTHEIVEQAPAVAVKLPTSEIAPQSEQVLPVQQVEATPPIAGSAEFTVPDNFEVQTPPQFRHPPEGGLSAEPVAPEPPKTAPSPSEIIAHTAKPVEKKKTPAKNTPSPTDIIKKG